MVAAEGFKNEQPEERVGRNEWWGKLTFCRAQDVACSLSKERTV